MIRGGSSPIVSSEELRLIKEFLILPLVLSVFERDMKAIVSVVKTPGPYHDALRRASDKITADLGVLKKAFYKRGIQVYQEERLPQQLQASYKCRGYHGSITLLFDRLKAEIELRMRRYLGEDMTPYERKDLPEGLVENISEISGVVH